MPAIMLRGLTGTSLVALSVLATPAHAATRPGPIAAPPSTPESTLYRPAAPAPAPAGSTPEAAARHHLQRAHGVTDARLLFVHDTGRGGIIVGLRQTLGGLDVLHADHKVLLDRSHALLAIAGNPRRALTTRAHFNTPGARARAVNVALRHLYDLDLVASPSKEPDRAGYTYLDVAVPAPVDLVLQRPARIKPIWFPQGEALVPAYYVEIQAALQRTRTRDAHALILGAGGEVLHRKNLIAHEAFSYRVYSTPDGRPLDSPLEDYNPHPAGAPTGGPTVPIFPTLIEMEGFNHNPDDAADPWLPPGAKETVGNNVDAYVDHNDPTGLGNGEYRAKINGFNSFDYVYDTTQEPLADQTQSMAAITSLFYVNNWMHDWWYDSGFNEAAGNAQASNFGRGGEENDVLLAEAQDAANVGARNNANMSTPADGESPRMQMYLWSPLVEETKFFADGVEYGVGQAQFGPRKYNVTAPLVVVDDGSEFPDEGCEPPQNDVSGKIVLIDRGTCSFELKATHVQNAGAVGVVFPDSLPNMDAYPPGPDADLVDPTIPAVGLSLADGQTLKDAIAMGAVSGQLIGNTSVERDGTLDNGIVSHEWGHYIHHRLVTCGINQCGGQSEGWGDFNAIMHSVREGDDLDGTYGMAPYGTFDTTGYFGLRRVAYTVDMTKNPLTLRHISDSEILPDVGPHLVPNGFPNAQSHNSGEVWSTMMWEVFVAIQKAHLGEPFEDNRRRVGDYVVSGMMMTAVDPTFNDQRDGILAAAHAADEADFLTIAEAFARRGLGTCAVSPDKFSETNDGVVEDFMVRPNGRILAASIDDSKLSCDDDHILDHDEIGELRLTIRNSGVAPMSGATLTMSADSPSVVFPDGDQIAVTDLDPQAETEVVVNVALVDDPPSIEDIKLTASLETPGGCDTAATIPLPTVLNGDVAENVSATDNVDAPITPWLYGGSIPDVWSRVAAAKGSLWHAADFGSLSDTWLISPTLEVSDTDPLVVSFLHAYAFEASDGTFWDGGVIELSTDDGMTWTDISMWADPGYDGMLTNEVNPLFGRLAFSGESPNFPSPQTLTLDLGNNFAGQDLRLRFRVATDAFVGAEGWYIDDIAFEGIDNTPFSEWIPDQCGDPQDPTTTGDAPTTGDTPTTDDVPTSTAPDPESGSESESETGNTDPGGLDDEGCGCNQSAPPAVLPLLALLALRRRRRTA